MKKLFAIVVIALCSAPALIAQVTISGNLTATAGQNILNAYSFNNIIYVDGNKYACSGTGIAQALSDGLVSPGSIINAQGCRGSGLTGAAWTIGSSSIPEVLLLGPSTWSMGSNQISLYRGSALIGFQRDKTQLTWTGDVDGILTPSSSSGGNVTIAEIAAINGSLATATNSVIHLQDCPRCVLSDVIVSIDSSVASAGIRIEPKTSSTTFGTWSGTLHNLTVQRTSPNQGTPATSGQIGLDMKGNTSLGDGDVSLWSTDGLWIEDQGIGFPASPAQRTSFCPVICSTTIQTSA